VVLHDYALYKSTFTLLLYYCDNECQFLVDEICPELRERKPPPRRLTSTKSYQRFESWFPD